MLTRTVGFVGTMALACGIVALSLSSTFSACDDEDEKKAAQKAQKAILELADVIDKPNGDARAQAKAIHDKNEELKPVMIIFRPRDKGGIGVGPKGRGDGIELRIKGWGSKKPLSPAELKRLAGDIERAARITRAVADVTDLYLPRKDQDEWKKATQAMREAAQEWGKAARSGDPVRFKKASEKLDASCVECHWVERR